MALPQLFNNETDNLSFTKKNLNMVIKNFLKKYKIDINRLASDKEYYHTTRIKMNTAIYFSFIDMTPRRETFVLEVVFRVLNNHIKKTMRPLNEFDLKEINERDENIEDKELESELVLD